jgi:thiol-disulfide isomerase/thioredoxin
MTEPLRVEFLTRQGCGLCDKAAAALDRVARELHLEVLATDIDADPLLLREFDWRVPVVRVEGRVLCEGLISEADLREALAGPVAAP